MSPYSHEFEQRGLDPQIMSGFLAALQNFMGEVTGTEQIRWKTVYGSDSTMLVEGGKWSIGVLSVRRETTEARSKLRRIVLEFEESFQELKDAGFLEGRILREFDNYVRRVFLRDRITEASIIVGNKTLESSDVSQSEFDVDELGILQSFKIEQSVEGIAKKRGMDIDSIVSLISRAIWQNLVDVIFIPKHEDILSLSEKSASVLFSMESSKSLSNHTLKVIANFDGRTLLQDHIKDLKKITSKKVLREIGLLISQGFVEKITIEQLLVLVNECILNNVMRTCSKIGSSSKSKSFFLKAKDKSLKKNPWAAMLQLVKGVKVKAIIESGLTPTDFDEFYEAIDLVIKELLKLLRKEKSDCNTEEIITDIKARCNKKWGRYLSEIMI